MTFPEKFLWGASTAAHQVEGNNVTSDWWQYEHGHAEGPRPIAQSSGDAADSFNRYPDDMRLLADAGLTAYRFSIEWARIEPEPGVYSRAAIDYYRRMVGTARDLGLTPMVTLHHFTNPAWFSRDIGWTNPRSVDLFARYVQRILPALADVELVCTINEPNVVAIAENLSASDNPEVMMPEAHPLVTEHLISAHQFAGFIVRDVGAKIGWSIAVQSFEPAPGVPGAEDAATEFARVREDAFLDAADGDDWVGIQSYTRQLVGPDGLVPPADGTETTLMGWEYYPRALETAIRKSWSRHHTPIYVTENGIATADDSRRIDYTREALEGVDRAIADGVDVRGYLHWSLLDNYEWGSYEPTFGLVGWDTETFERHPKPSLAWLGDVARHNGLGDAPADAATPTSTVTTNEDETEGIMSNDNTEKHVEHTEHSTTTGDEGHYTDTETDVEESTEVGEYTDADVPADQPAGTDR